MWSLSDEALLAGLGSGDPEATTAFVRRFQSRVFGLALTILGDQAAAEDIAQETFVRVWQHAGSYDARRGRVATWVLSIARNLAIDALRLRRCDPVETEVIGALLGSRDEPAADSLSVGADAQRLRHGLASLPEEQRRALLLAVFQGRTAREIAEMEQTPVGTAKTRLRTALLKLRSELEVADDR